MTTANSSCWLLSTLATTFLFICHCQAQSIYFSSQQNQQQQQPQQFHPTSPFAVNSNNNAKQQHLHHGARRNTFGNKTKELHLLYLYTKDGSEHAAGMLPAVMLAEMLINRRSDILPNYKLVIDKIWTHFEDKLDPIVTTRVLQNALRSANYTYYGVIGPGWTSEAAAAADVARDNNLIDMSGAATGPGLNNDKGDFPTFFRTVTSDGDFITAQVALLKSLGYSTVLATYQKQAFFLDFMNDIESKLKTGGLHVGMSDGFEEDPGNSFQYPLVLPRKHEAMDVTIQKLLGMSQVPVILSVFGDMSGRDLVCQAYKRGITSRTHIWIVTAPITMGWWNVPANGPYDCYPEELEDALIGSFWLTYHGEVNRTNEQLHQMHVDMYMATLQAIAWTEFGNISSDFNFNPMTHQSFDAVWSMALALNKTEQQLESLHRRTLESFNYRDAQTKSLMVDNLLQTDFLGPSGRVRFKSNHERLGFLNIMQYQNQQLGFVQVGLFDNGPKNEIIWLNELIFNTPDNKPPKGKKVLSSTFV